MQGLAKLTPAESSFAILVQSLATLRLAWSDDHHLPERESWIGARQPPSLKLALTLKTALTIENAMKPTKMNTLISTLLEITLVK